MQNNLTSIELKALLMYYFRFIRHFKLVATEVCVLDSFFADVITTTEKDIVEVEIKTSLSDFEHEFTSKDHKHEIYLNEQLNPGRKLPKQVYKKMPNRLFYAVEPRLTRDVLKIINGTPYGLMEVTKSWDSPVRVVKPAQKLHHTFPSIINERAICRCSSELVSMYVCNLKV